MTGYNLVLKLRLLRKLGRTVYIYMYNDHYLM